MPSTGSVARHFFSSCWDGFARAYMPGAGRGRELGVHHPHGGGHTIRQRAALAAHRPPKPRHRSPVRFHRLALPLLSRLRTRRRWHRGGVCRRFAFRFPGPLSTESRFTRLQNTGSATNGGTCSGIGPIVILQLFAPLNRQPSLSLCPAFFLTHESIVSFFQQNDSDSVSTYLRNG